MSFIAFSLPCLPSPPISVTWDHLLHKLLASKVLAQGLFVGKFNLKHPPMTAFQFPSWTRSLGPLCLVQAPGSFVGRVFVLMEATPELLCC